MKKNTFRILLVICLILFITEDSLRTIFIAAAIMSIHYLISSKYILPVEAVPTTKDKAILAAFSFFCIAVMFFGVYFDTDGGQWGVTRLYESRATTLMFILQYCVMPLLCVSMIFILNNSGWQYQGMNKEGRLCFSFSRGVLTPHYRGFDKQSYLAAAECFPELLRRASLDARVTSISSTSPLFSSQAHRESIESIYNETKRSGVKLHGIEFVGNNKINLVAFPYWLYLFMIKPKTRRYFDINKQKSFSKWNTLIIHTASKPQHIN